jgi:hypothetical protein
MQFSRLGLTLVFLQVATALAVGQSQYFPSGLLESADKHSVSDWYSKHLVAMKEPSLFELSENHHAQQYRFLYLRTFDHPIVIRLVVNPDGTGTYITKELSGAGGYEPGRLILNRRTQQPAEYVRQVQLNYIEEIHFWALPTKVSPPDGKIGLDGARWILEAIKDGKYHIVDRWSPNVDTWSADDARFRQLCLRFLREPNLKLSFSEVY